MNVPRIANLNIRPTDRKMRKAKELAEKSGILPKEMPIEKKIYIESQADTFERIKDSIQLSIDNMRGNR